MDLKKRKNYIYGLHTWTLKYIKNGICPICKKPVPQNRLNRNWKCCSKECLEKLYEKYFYSISWGSFKFNALKRDNYTCCKCGKQCEIEELMFFPNNYNDDILGKTDDGKYIVYNTSKLVVDHIIPIALGGQEFDVNNLQTLCLECNRVKTDKDIEKINKYKKMKNVDLTLLNKCGVWENE